MSPLVKRGRARLRALTKSPVADDPYAPADLGRGQVFQAWARCLDEDLAAAYAFDGLRVDRLQGGVTDPHQALEDRVGFRLVFLDRAGQRSRAADRDQGVQGRSGLPPDARLRPSQWLERQLEGRPPVRQLRPIASRGTQAQAVGECGKATGEGAVATRLELMIDGGSSGSATDAERGREGRRRSVH